MLNQLIIEKYLTLEPDVNSKKPNGFKNLAKGDKITIPPMIGHVFEAIEHTIVLELTTTEFDIQNTFYRELASA